MPEHHPLRGIFLMLLAILCFASLDASVKYLAPRIPVPILVWMRYLVHFLLMLAALGPSMGRGLLRTGKAGSLIKRSVTMLLTTIFGMMAVRAMPLAEATAMIFMSPLLVALLAGPLLKEKIGKTRWLATTVGFVGVLLIARPGGSISLMGLLWGLATALAYAVYQIQTRHLVMTENTWVLLFYTALIGTAVTTLALPLYWVPLHPHGLDLLLLCCLGAFGGGGHFLLTRAFRFAPASTLSPLLYAQLLWATLLGGFIFQHWPDGISLLGMVLIVGSSLAMALVERRGAKAAT